MRIEDHCCRLLYQVVTEDNAEERQESHQDLVNTNCGAVGESLHCVVENHRHTVIEQALTEDQEVQADVDVDLLEDSEDGHGIHYKQDRRDVVRLRLIVEFS